jgi:hypothetical protein
LRHFGQSKEFSWCKCGLVWLVCHTGANLVRVHMMATKKKRQAKKSVRPGEYVRSGECTRGAPVVACAVRAVRACDSGVRAAEEAEEYLSAAVGYEMRYAPWIVYNHRAPAHDPPSTRCAACSARQKRPHRAPKRRILHPTFEPPLQAAAAERVAHNDAQCTSYGMGFLL